MADKKADAGELKVLARNKRVRHDYHVERTLEAGIALRGSEVKSIRDARVTMSDAYAGPHNGELWLHQLQINEWPFAHHFQHEPKRDRKLLVHRREMEDLIDASQAKGYTLLPLELYLKRGKVKVLLGVCKGKQQHDKREASKERDAQREMDRAMRSARKR